MDDILVCPDLHGRRELLDHAINSYIKEEIPIIFLGDYLDGYPYDFLEIDNLEKEVFSVLKYLISFAKENPDDITLLLGDHEGQYVGLSNSLARFDFNNAYEIYKLLKENESIFTGAFIYNNALFTHAGVSENWLETNDLHNNYEFVYNYINKHIKFSDSFDIPDYRYCGISNNCVWNIGRSRGGNSNYGGPFWADVKEMIVYGNAAFNGQINQIFAHSQLKDTGTFIHKDNWWMCDSRAVFIWNGKELKLYK